MAIRDRKNPEDPIDWNDLKSLRFTRAVRNLWLSLNTLSGFSIKYTKLNKISFGLLFLMQVIFETSRLATIVNGVLRKTTEDMELNGELKKFVFFVLASIVFLWAQEAVLQLPSLFRTFAINKSET